jgi:hypothetical protein
VGDDGGQPVEGGGDGGGHGGGVDLGGAGPGRGGEDQLLVVEDVPDPCRDLLISKSW